MGRAIGRSFAREHCPAGLIEIIGEWDRAFREYVFMPVFGRPVDFLRAFEVLELLDVGFVAKRRHIIAVQYFAQRLRLHINGSDDVQGHNRVINGVSGVAKRERKLV